MAKQETLVLGAVAYDRKVVTIWEGFKRWFIQNGLDFDYILYSNYERQVAAQFAGHFQVAWNSPLAWIEAERVAKARGTQARAIAMRDSDQDLTSVVVVRADSAIHDLGGLKGKTVAVGASDSPQATLIPLLHLAEQGLEPERDFKVRRFDVLVGLHGDHIGGERDAAKALAAGEVDAACFIDGNHLLFVKEGTLKADGTRIVAQTGPYDHCNFTVLDGAFRDGAFRDGAFMGGAPKHLAGRFGELLLGMKYDQPDVRPLMDLEGLKAWKPGRVSGYAQLERAVDRFGALKPWLETMGVRA